MQKVRLQDAFASFDELWSPRIVGELNGQHVKLVKLAGDFVWHHHEDEDELFLVVQGSFRMDYRDAGGAERSQSISAGEFVIVPRGVEHKPSAESECHVLLFEPDGTVNTGNVRSERTVASPVKYSPGPAANDQGN